MVTAKNNGTALIAANGSVIEKAYIDKY